MNRERGEVVEGELGKRIRAARVYGQYSQLELARKLGISVGTLVQYEKGHREVPAMLRPGLAAQVVELTGMDERWVMAAVGGPGV